MRNYYFVLPLFFMALTGMASQDREFGIGGLTTGRVGNVVAEPENPFSVRYNPALLPVSKSARVEMSFSTVSTQFDSLKSIRLDGGTYRTEEAVDNYGDFTLPEKTEMVWAMGAAIPFRILDDRAFGLGFAVSGPFGQLHSLSARSPYDFYSLRYGQSSSQLQATVGLGAEIIPDTFFLGAGLNFFLSSSGNGETTIATEDPVGRLQVDVGLNASPLAGAYFRSGDWSAGLSYRASFRPKFQQRLTAKMQVNGVEALEQPFTASTVFFDEPESWQLDGQWSWEGGSVSAGVNFERWSTYQAPFLSIETSDASGGVATTPTPVVSLADTFSPRLSSSFWLWSRTTTLSVGYRWRPTPVRDLSGVTNILDSNAHIFGLSVDRKWSWTGELVDELAVTAFAQYHWMLGRSVLKTDGQMIGAPGFTFSSKAYLLGLSVRASL